MRKKTSWPVFWLDHMGKGRFIKTYGRDAWNRLPRSAIVKEGKRAFVTREAILDNLWMAPPCP
jgi:hypothetical protein